MPTPRTVRLPLRVGAAASPARQIDAFIDRFEPRVARLVKACRAALRKRLPTAIEQVYDNYNFLVFGYRIESADTLKAPAVAALIDQAVKEARTPLPIGRGGYTMVKSVSAKQRPRR